MNLETYIKAAQRTSATTTAEDKKRNAALGLIGESGEICDLVKKQLYQGKPMDAGHFVKECGDVMWYVAEGCVAMGYDASHIDRRMQQTALYHDGVYSAMSIERLALTLARQAAFGIENLPRIAYIVQKLCAMVGYTLQACMDINIEKLKARYPDGFDVERSEKREKGDV